MVVRCYILQDSAEVISQLWREDDGRWGLGKTSGEQFFAIISPPVFTSSYLIVISFLVSGGIKISLPIFKDSLSKDDFRRLKVILRTM